MVCRYIEAGNMVGEFKEKVGDLKKDITMDKIAAQMKEAGVQKRNHVAKMLRKTAVL